MVLVTLDFLSRRAVDSLVSLSEYNRFSKGLFSWIGYNELIIEYENVLRSDGESKWTFSKLLNYGIDGVISFNNKPLRLSIYLGFNNHFRTFIRNHYVRSNHPWWCGSSWLLYSHFRYTIYWRYSTHIPRCDW